MLIEGSCIESGESELLSGPISSRLFSIRDYESICWISYTFSDKLIRLSGLGNQIPWTCFS